MNRQAGAGGELMPFETIACSRSGSADVQEVKPSTYFCNHCETVFKCVDPTRLTVRNNSAFRDEPIATRRRPAQ